MKGPHPINSRGPTTPSWIRRCVVCAVLGLGASGVLSAPSPAAVDPRSEGRMVWFDVYAPPQRKVVRLDFERIPRQRVLRAAVLRTDTHVRITLVSNVPEDAVVQGPGIYDCVEVKVGRRIGSRHVVEGVTGRRRRSVADPGLMGDEPCRRVPVRFYGRSR